jgi:hypothetical protein
MSDWISVKERMPEAGGCYLICGRNLPFARAVYVAHLVYFESGPAWSFDGHFNAVDGPTISHWMPLPDPPKVRP